jgi:hypothetical protein
MSLYPRDWSTTYNTQYRDRRRFATPHPGFVDEALFARAQGYYGVKPAISEHSARIAEYQARGLTAPQGLVAPYGSTSATNSASYSEAYYKAAGATANANAALPPISTRISTASAAAFPTTRTYNSWAYRDLWGATPRPHTGVYSDRSTIRGGVMRSCDDARSANYDNVADLYATNSGTNFPSFPPGAQPNEVAPGVWAYDANSDVRSQSARAVPAPKDATKERFHVPGYQGFIRGIQFQHGDTYGKTTRVCLDVPTDVPIEP